MFRMEPRGIKKAPLPSVRWFSLAWSVFIWLLGSVGNTAEPVHYGRQILPILSENCYHCHGPDEAARKGGLRLDTREGAVAERAGRQAVKPGDSAGSEMIRRVFSSDSDDLMPPSDSHRVLSAEHKALLKRWVDEGAVWGKHWAFEPPVQPEIPKARLRRDSRENPIDAFVAQSLKARSLKSSPEAGRAELLRRVTLDLTGIPPTTAELQAWISDRRSDAYERLVDRLLASPRYGERMAWDWLDAARYADSNGYQGDPTRTMWPWRDWVIRALNENMPYDRFTIDQIAGDLVPDARLEHRLATGFLRNHMINGEGGRIPEENRIDYLFDQTETVGTVWLGLTATCARCHDHKFDPFTQADYYSLLAFFNNTPVGGGDGSGQAAPVMDVSTPENHARVHQATVELAGVGAELDRLELSKFPRAEGKGAHESEKARDLPGNITSFVLKNAATNRPLDRLVEAVNYFKEHDTNYASALERLLKATERRNNARAEIPKVMIMAERTNAEPRDTFVLARGLYTKPGLKVTPRLPGFLTAAPPEGTPRMTRLDLAKWLTDPSHPLAARTAVNRAWQTFFGSGLVRTPEDFGVQGEKPTHPELLDWLAVEFVRSGWNVKALHRLIVTSRTYRQSSRVGADLLEKDPDNRWLTRGPRHRMPSWMIRDQALAVSGLWTDRLGGPPVKPYQPAGVWEEATFGFIRYRQDQGEALYRRSLYTFWRRIVGPTLFFDVATRQTCSVKAPRTNTPLHALATLNDVTYVEAARQLATRSIRHSKSDADRLKFAFLSVVLREPDSRERTRLLERVQELKVGYQASREEAMKLIRVGDSKPDESLDPIEHAAWTTICLTLLNLDEALSTQ
ncbi:MAG: DUF1553 domain-containing protein [Verrucomicrobia bacterium]|nr:DUF1553 domain-containing protein [Verrucomicrobiota bacterium]